MLCELIVVETMCSIRVYIDCFEEEVSLPDVIYMLYRHCAALSIAPLLEGETVLRGPGVVKSMINLMVYILLIVLKTMCSQVV